MMNRCWRHLQDAWGNDEVNEKLFEEAVLLENENKLFMGANFDQSVPGPEETLAEDSKEATCLHAEDTPEDMPDDMPELLGMGEVETENIILKGFNDKFLPEDSLLLQLLSMMQRPLPASPATAKVIRVSLCRIGPFHCWHLPLQLRR